MSKITFRADDDLVDQLEGLEASKSEIMRDALRSYLSDASQAGQPTAATTDQNGVDPIDDLIRDRVDTLLSDRLQAQQSRGPQDVNITIAVDGDDAGRNTGVTQPPTEQPVAADRGHSECGQCGETVDSDHVYCPNCGEKASQRSFCECGDELRSDWAFCPSCGRRTPAANVLDSNS